ncbi:UNVERIFIED_CONTAM: hypothetical protein Sangu_3211900 [Sesamum angustifolium]|uniref:Uncharacterized protein n=1 Tax=Sesamum angustifolium TaxID=2727405 RepID=A0AAW2JJM7_9LAMI
MATMMGPRPPFAMEVVGLGGFSSTPAMAELQTSPEASNPPRSWFAPPSSPLTQPLTSPLSGSPATGIAPASLPEFSVSPPRVWAAPPHQSASTVALPVQPFSKQTRLFMDERPPTDFSGDYSSNGKPDFYCDCPEVRGR